VAERGRGPRARRMWACDEWSVRQPSCSRRQETSMRRRMRKVSTSPPKVNGEARTIRASPIVPTCCRWNGQGVGSA
jgi:hypothetical protein